MCRNLKIENRTMWGSLSLREARANVAEIKDLCLGHVTLRTLRPLLKKIQGHWHTNGVISITRVSLLARWVEPVRSKLEKTYLVYESALFFWSDHSFFPRTKSKVIIEKSNGGRFLWNRNWDLGCIWADWQCWKKGTWADHEQLLRVFFSCFQEQKTLERPH